MKRIRFVSVLSAGVVGFLAVSSHAAVLINEVYPNGGSSAATSAYTRDFVELFNTGATPVDLSGYKIQYFTAAGGGPNVVFNFIAGSVIGAGDSLVVVSGSAGTGGATLTGTPTDGTNGTGGGSGLAAAGGTIKLVDPSSAILDFVGWGTATVFDGAAAPAAGATNAFSLSRDASHTDSNNNLADFSIITPTPNAGTLSTAVTPEPACLGLIGLVGVLGFRRGRRA